MMISTKQILKSSDMFSSNVWQIEKCEKPDQRPKIKYKYIIPTVMGVHYGAKFSPQTHTTQGVSGFAPETPAFTCMQQNTATE